VRGTYFLSLATALAVVASVAAQEGGRGGGGGFGGDEAAGSVRARTRFEQFTSRLRLPPEKVTPILEAAAREGGPIGIEMATLQTQLANAILTEKPEAEIKPILDAYTKAAASMIGLEAKAFGEIYALLPANQRNNAPQAFDMMAGWFHPPPGAAARGGRTGGRGGAQ
jgi:hypothetical protein